MPQFLRYGCCQSYQNPHIDSTFATRALESGMSPKTLSKILGHSSVGFTLDTYAHVTEELKTEQIAGMNNFL